MLTNNSDKYEINLAHQVKQNQIPNNKFLDDLYKASSNHNVPNLLHCYHMAFCVQSKIIEGFTITTVQLVNLYNLILLLGRAFCMTWNSVVLFHLG